MKSIEDIIKEIDESDIGIHVDYQRKEVCIAAVGDINKKKIGGKNSFNYFSRIYLDELKNVFSFKKKNYLYVKNTSQAERVLCELLKKNGWTIKASKKTERIEDEKDKEYYENKTVLEVLQIDYEYLQKQDAGIYISEDGNTIDITYMRKPDQIRIAGMSMTTYIKNIILENKEGPKRVKTMAKKVIKETIMRQEKGTIKVITNNYLSTQSGNKRLLYKPLIQRLKKEYKKYNYRRGLYVFLIQNLKDEEIKNIKICNLENNINRDSFFKENKFAATKRKKGPTLEQIKKIYKIYPPFFEKKQNQKRFIKKLIELESLLIRKTVRIIMETICTKDEVKLKRIRRYKPEQIEEKSFIFLLQGKTLFDAMIAKEGVEHATRNGLGQFLKTHGAKIKEINEAFKDMTNSPIRKMWFISYVINNPAEISTSEIINIAYNPKATRIRVEKELEKKPPLYILSKREKVILNTKKGTQQEYFSSGQRKGEYKTHNIEGKQATDRLSYLADTSTIEEEMSRQAIYKQLQSFFSEEEYARFLEGNITTSDVAKVKGKPWLLQQLIDLVYD